MNALRKYTLFVSFSAGLLSTGIPYWMIPYSKVNLPHSLIGLPLGLLAVLALVPPVAGSISFRRTTLVMGGCVPFAVMLRVIVEGIADPTSHNLWPFELIIAAALGLACSAAGAAVGASAARLLHQATK